MLKKIIGICFYIIIFSSAGNAMKVIDSLKQIVETLPEDSLKCETYIKIAYLLYDGQEAIEYSHKALDLAHKLNNPKLLGRSFHRAAWCHDYDEMNLKTSYLDSAALVFRSINDKNGLGKVYDTKGVILMNYGSFEESGRAYQQGYDFYVETSNEERQAGILNNWAICDYMNGLPEKAIVKYNRALDYRLSEQPSSPVEIARIYVGLGECSRLLGNYNLALENYIKSYEYRTKIKNIAAAESLINMASMIYEAAEKDKDTTILVQNLKTIGLSNTQELLDSAMVIPGVSESNGFMSAIMDVKRRKHLLNQEYLQAYQILWDQKIMEEDFKLSESSLEALADMKIQYERERLRNRLLEEEISNSKKAKQVNVLVFSMGVLISALIIGVLYYQNRIKANQLLLTEAKQEQQIISMRSMLDGQEKERSRIARDLHDGLGNLLSTLKAKISTLKIDFDNHGTTRIYNTASDMIDEACSEVRKIAHEMMPQALKKLGLRKALEDLINKMDITHSFNAQFLVYGSEKKLDDNTNVMLYRIVQELLNNIVKYANADEVLLQLTYSDEWLNLTIEDDGIGFDKELIDSEKGMGLKSIEFRTGYVGGNYEIDSRPGAGTLVTINVPLLNENRDSSTENEIS